MRRRPQLIRLVGREAAFDQVRCRATFAESLQVIRTGEDRRNDGPPMLQAMAWPVFDQLRDRDLRAIYEFLSAIPSLPGNF